MDRFYELKNIALGKDSWGSSQHQEHDASRANSADETCAKQFISGNHKNNYWTVDLERRAVVLNVTVKATRPENEQHSVHFTIKVGDDGDHNGNNNPHCIHNQHLPLVMQNFTCANENEGRYVTIHQHNGNHHRHLRLCYVKVFGIYL